MAAVVDNAAHRRFELEEDGHLAFADYRREDVVGRDVVEQAGGDVILVDLVPGHSTTAIVERARPTKRSARD